jgi:O-antigen ligase
LILDNQYLGTLIETGVIGLLALILVFVVPLLCARGVRRRSARPETRDLAQSLAAAVMVGMLSFATFDGLSFPMATNLLFLLLGCCGALRRLEREDSSKQPTQYVPRTALLAGREPPVAVRHALD